MSATICGCVTVTVRVQIVSALYSVLSGEWFGSLGGLFGVYSVPAWVGIPVTVFIVVYITNAINLIDGIDGLASGLCSIALSVLSVIFFIRMQYVYALLAICTLGVLMPFLVLQRLWQRKPWP